MPLQAIKPDPKMARFTIPVGVPCAVSKVSPRLWKSHKTTRESGFDACENYDRKIARYTFRSGGWLIQVDRHHVIHREDLYRAQTEAYLKEEDERRKARTWTLEEKIMASIQSPRQGRVTLSSEAVQEIFGHLFTGD